jgi:hypothetical protein
VGGLEVFGCTKLIRSCGGGSSRGRSTRHSDSSSSASIPLQASICRGRVSRF